jgi:hypothetical protein
VRGESMCDMVRTNTQQLDFAMQDILGSRDP